MRRLALLTMLGLAVIAMTLASCGGKDQPVQEEVAPPVTINPEDTATPPPPPPPPPPPKVLNDGQLGTVYFDFDKANVRSDAKAKLDENYQLLNEFSDAIVQLEGHCDERGTVEYNLALGERRAKAVQAYLIGLGIPAARLQTISYGEERPAQQGANESAWSKNRRVEFKVVSQ